MDQNTLVEGGNDGVRRVADVFRFEGFDVEASYLVRRLSIADDEPEWVLVLVIPGFGPSKSRDLVYKLVDLRRAGRLPFIDPQVRVQGVPPGHPEASCLLAYLRASDHPPPMVRHLGIDGLLIDYALIGDDRGRPAKAA